MCVNSPSALVAKYFPFAEKLRMRMKRKEIKWNPLGNLIGILPYVKNTSSMRF